MTNSQKMLAFAREQLGELYDLGDHGPDLWDCSGLTMEMAELCGLKWPHSSHSQYYSNKDLPEFGTTDTMPRDKDCFIFRYGERTSGKGMGMIHVGYYASDKQTEIQAGGNGPIVNKEVYLANLAAGMSKIDAVKNSLAKNHPGGTKKSVVWEQSFHSNYFTHWRRGDWMDKDMSETPQEAPGATMPTLSYDKPPAPVRAEVKTLQTLLNAWNDTLPVDAFTPLKVDGKFGTNTQAAVVAFQASHGLETDGVVGPITWGALNSTNQPVEQPEEPTYTVQVCNLSADEADELVRQYYPNATVIES